MMDERDFQKEQLAQKRKRMLEKVKFHEEQTLEELVAQITDKNMHDEIETDPIGDEIW